MVGQDLQWYSTDGGISWTAVDSPLSGNWRGVAFGNGIFVMVNGSNSAYSEDNGKTWTLSGAVSGINLVFGDGVFITQYSERSIDNGLSWEPPAGVSGNCIAYGNGVFVIPGWYSIDKGVTWQPGEFVNTDAMVYGNGNFVCSGYFKPTYFSSDFGLTWNNTPSQIENTGIHFAANNQIDEFPFNTGTSGFKNLIAVGNYIYFSTNQGAGRFDTSSSFTYDFPAPVLPTGQYVFANGPRYIYMFSQSDPAAQNIVRFDPYPPTPTLQTSILVDYESLPPEVPKPDKALLGLIQTQKVTDMNYMNIRGPVKELWVTGTSDSANVFQYSNLAAQSTLALTAGEEIITEDVGTHTFLNTIEPFETHTSMPIRNVSVIPFEFDPESAVPNGTVNFSRIRDQVFNGGAETVWARTYNLLAIQGGIGGLIFNS